MDNLQERIEDLDSTRRQLEQENQKLREAFTKLGGIFFYGNFKVETFAEKELKEFMEKEGFFFENEDDYINALTKYLPQQPEREQAVLFDIESLVDGWNANVDWMSDELDRQQRILALRKTI